jgi:hypothetical protein
VDPNANLAEQNTCTDPARLRDLRSALADWLAGRGFAPTWQAYPAASDDFRSWCRQYRPDVAGQVPRLPLPFKA